MATYSSKYYLEQKMQHITQKDIADKLGVTRITISKALSDSLDISLEMRENVKRIAQEMGYIPADLEDESVSKTLEYSYDDWCIAMIAQSLGAAGDYNTFIKRAQYYKNVFDPSTGFMREKK